LSLFFYKFAGSKVEEMKTDSAFLIPFVGLKDGHHHFDYELDNTFFEGYDFLDFNEVNIKVALNFEKKPTILTLDFKAQGKVKIPCDITTELFDFPLDTEFQLVVKFGAEVNQYNDEILILPQGSYELSVSQHLYEMIVLAIPQKRVHPGIEDGTLKSEILDKLKELQLQQEAPSEDVDPRWDKLKDLL
jgi:uncharacterized metal-binding protein YceD (DUF177 family)